MSKPPLKHRALILAALVLWALVMALPVFLSLRVTAA
jgi:hypothetical protein